MKEQLESCKAPMSTIEFSNDAQLKFKKNIDDLILRLYEKIAKQSATAEFLVFKATGHPTEGAKQEELKLDQIFTNTSEKIFEVVFKKIDLMNEQLMENEKQIEESSYKSNIGNLVTNIAGIVDKET